MDQPSHRESHAWPLDVDALDLSLKSSMDRLKKEKINSLLLHEAHPISANAPDVITWIKKLKSQGIIDHAGLGGSNLGDGTMKIDHVYDVLQTEYYIGGNQWPHELHDPETVKIAYSPLRPIKNMTDLLNDQNLRREWKQSLDSDFVGCEGLAVWMIAWILMRLPDSSVVFFSSNATHIKDITKGTAMLLADAERIRKFESLALKSFKKSF